MASLVPSLRTRIPRIATYATRTATRSFTSSSRLLLQSPGTGENLQQANVSSAPKQTQNVSQTNETPVDAMGARDEPYKELVPEAEHKRQMQSPNRANTWSKSQMPRELAMTGPRFEQTIIASQPAPYAAIDLIHQQPAQKAHKKHLESLPSTTYPLAPTNNPAQVQMPSSPTQKGEIQGHYPQLKGEHDAESVGGQPLQQR
ncbi:hypothetical protein LTR84_004001 [Exophiala bonariae]|uniref:Uncharacterized protein n=1 Tax=Exophiala bonariae TaxID=1690606 RepID=A0AAV9N5G7_9EURO|nr:hypothetical protein LTR84_004001 [Exophiala bonariae]